MSVEDTFEASQFLTDSSENINSENNQLSDNFLNDTEIDNEENQELVKSHDDKQSDPTEPTEKLVKLPLARIKHIMKMDPDVSLISQDAVFVVAKATELFISSLAREAYSFTMKSKKKTIQRKDLDAAIEAVDALAFLEGAID